MDGSELSKQHWNKIASSKIVGFVNWAAMDYGTEVAEKVFNFAKEKKYQNFFRIRQTSWKKKWTLLISKQRS